MGGCSSSVAADIRQEHGPTHLEHKHKFATKTGLLDLQNESTVESAPSWMSSVPLKVINLSGTRIQRLPEPSGITCGRLQKLIVSNARLKGPQPDLSPYVLLNQLILSGNHLDSIPALPPSLTILDVSRNPRLGPAFPLQQTTPAMHSLIQLDLSACNLMALGPAITLLVALQELRLDGNKLETLELLGSAEHGAGATPRPDWSALTSLRLVSARGNALHALPGVLPEALLAKTMLVVLNLDGNVDLTVRWLQGLPGYPAFETRRARHLSKGIAGDVHDMQGRTLCGLD